MCDEWRNDFMAFYLHIGAKPEGFELDRIDNSKGYEPQNVRWATRKQNVMNRRNTIFVEINGERISLEDYAAKEGIKYGTAWARLKKHPHLLNGGRQKKSGENNSQSKLTNQQADEIRKSDEKVGVLAELFSVSVSLIRGIKNGSVRAVNTLESSRRYEAKTL